MKELENYIGIEEAAAFLGIKKSTLYTWVHRSLITHYKPSGRKGLVLFKKSELEERIKRGERPARGDCRALAPSVPILSKLYNKPSWEAPGSRHAKASPNRA